MALSTQPYKGARDFYPENKRLQKYMFDKIRESVEKFGYEEYDAPIIEPLEIFSAKTGDEIVSEQTYAFEDRGGRKVVIRPEMTPSVSRMVAARRQELPYPLRWYSIVDNWRYERPQRGRMRQFYQLNVDLFGVEGLEADVEAVQVADAVLKSFGADSSMYEIRVNSRKAMIELLENIGYEGNIITKIIGLFDRLDKVGFKAYLDKNFTPDDAKKLESFIQNTSPEEILNTKAGRRITELISLLSKQNINVKPDITLNRGFEYYTDIVFEVFDTNPENKRSMFGGGRYDGLVGLFGVEPVPAVGFAMGDVTLQDFLRSNNLLPVLQPATEVYAVMLSSDKKAVEIVGQLREEGLNVAVDSSTRKLEKQIKTADKLGVQYVVFIGEKEIATGKLTIKNIQTGEEQKTALKSIAKIVKN